MASSVAGPVVDVPSIGLKKLGDLIFEVQWICTRLAVVAARGLRGVIGVLVEC